MRVIPFTYAFLHIIHLPLHTLYSGQCILFVKRYVFFVFLNSTFEVSMKREQIVAKNKVLRSEMKPNFGCFLSKMRSSASDKLFVKLVL